MPDYSKSVIYLLRHKDDINLENIYIGSTKDFRSRIRGHKTQCNNASPKNKNYNNKQYVYIRENGGWENWIIKIIEEYPCNSVKELTAKEDEIMLQYPNRLNEHRAKRSPQQYSQDNKEKRKQYRENNKEKIKIYIENNKEKIKDYNKVRYNNNKEYNKEIHKKYYENNIEKIKEKITCECGSIIRKSDLAKHKRTKKHINIMK